MSKAQQYVIDFVRRVGSRELNRIYNCMTAGKESCINELHEAVVKNTVCFKMEDLNVDLTYALITSDTNSAVCLSQQCQKIVVRCTPMQIVAFTLFVAIANYIKVAQGAGDRLLDKFKGIHFMLMDVCTVQKQNDLGNNVELTLQA